MAKKATVKATNPNFDPRKPPPTTNRSGKTFMQRLAGGNE